jgi:di/tricarboxylate transporter
MAAEAWYTLAVLTVMFGALVKEVLGADIVVFIALTALWAAGIIDTDQALSGFGNAQMLTVGLLFVVAQAMQDTGALSRLSGLVLARNPRSPFAVFRMIVPIAGLSAFMNNTPIVAMFTPTVRDWASRGGAAPSKFLIPLSYATILGGTLTLIGTSTNLVVSGLLDAAGHGAFSMFELTPIALPATLLGLVYLGTIGRRLLPDRRAPDQVVASEVREYLVRLSVTPDYEFIGKSVEEAGLRHLSGLFLAEIERGGERIVPVTPSDQIRVGDRLVLFGDARTVVDLRNMRGLVAVSDDDDETGDASPQIADRRLYEVVISSGSPLVGQTLREASFRRRYDAVVIAIHRNGVRLNQKLGEVELRAGDTLMVEGARGFRSAWGDSTDFYLVAAVEGAERPRYGLANLSLAIMLAMVILFGTEVIPTVQAAALAAGALILARCVRPSSARRSIDISVLIVIAASFGIGEAVRSSGLADSIASAVTGIGGTNPIFLWAALYLITAALTELLSNNAAAALVMPIALAAAQMAAGPGGEVNAHPYAIVVAIAASCSFITPFGYQTNIMVYGPGGYRFRDFSIVGAPLTIICFVATVSMLWLLYT